MKCNGKCYLGKQLKKAEEKQGNDASRQTKKWEEISACKIPVIHYTLNFAAVIAPARPEYTNYYSFGFSQSVFHPPTIFFS